MENNVWSDPPRAPAPLHALHRENCFFFSPEVLYPALPAVHPHVGPATPLGSSQGRR